MNFIVIHKILSNENMEELFWREAGGRAVSLPGHPDTATMFLELKALNLNEERSKAAEMIQANLRTTGWTTSCWREEEPAIRRPVKRFTGKSTG